MKKYALMVDDHRIAYLIHGNLLKNMGYLVLEATEGKEAIDQFLAHCPKLLDAVLMDYNIPWIKKSQNF